MSIRYRTLIAASVRGLVAAAFVIAIGAQAYAQQPQQQKQQKLDKAQMADARALTEALDAAQTVNPTSSVIPVALLSHHFFRAGNGQTYTPFTITVDPQALANPSVAVMWRAVSTSAAPVNQVRPAAYQDLEFTVLKAEAGQPAQLSRWFQVPAGDYELYIGVKERNPADKSAKPKLTVIKQAVKVPDFQGTELVTSSLVVCDKMDQLASPLKAAEQREHPYTIGLLQIEPKVGTKFAKTQELIVYFQIYNPALDANKKPDIVEEFDFFLKQGATEKKVFNSEPTVLNASTLPPQFDSTKFALPGGSAWPLTSFPAGDYRLEIKVQDKLSGKSLTQTVNFTVGS